MAKKIIIPLKELILQDAECDFIMEGKKYSLVEDCFSPYCIYIKKHDVYMILSDIVKNLNTEVEVI